MQHRFVKFLAAAALAAGSLYGQGGMPGGRCGGGNCQGDPPAMQARHLNFLSTFLELTETQKQQATTIFESAAKAAQTLHPLLQQAQTALHDAAKANASPTQIDALAADAGKLMGQMRAIHVKAFAAFYQILTPVQREKFDKMHEAGPGAFGPGAGLGPGAGFGGRGPR
jgi:Spy/CpxP family protein refolding chaperone